MISTCCGCFPTPFRVSRTAITRFLMICWGNFPIGMFLPSTLSVVMFVASTLQSFLVASPPTIALASSRQESYPQCLQFKPGRLLYIALTDLYPELHQKIGFGSAIRQFFMIMAGIGTMILFLQFRPRVN